MDSATIAGWLVALATLGVLWITIRNRNQDMNASKISEQLKPINEAIIRHDAHHARHFANSAANATAIATLAQEVTDHNKHDEDRFDRIEEMHKEIRNDIKELLSR